MISLNYYHRNYTMRNKWEKMEHKGVAIFDIPFMIQSHAEIVKKILISGSPLVGSTS